MLKAKELDLGKVNFFPPVPHEQVPAILASMDVAIISLKSNILGAVPSKIYEAMASGIPILLIAQGESQVIVDKAKAGFTIAPGDINGLIQAIRRIASEPHLRQEMGRAGRGAAVSTYDRAGIVGKFLEKICKIQSIQATRGCCHIL
jgi:glycosyltransferase involved in cell wall biosynthesis